MTILFGLIQDFAAICIKVDAMTVVQLVSEVFSLFDILSESHKVYKVNILLFIHSIDDYAKDGGKELSTKMHCVL